MKKTQILSKLFSTDCEFSINCSYGSDINFDIGNNEVVYEGSRLLLWNSKLERIIVQFSEIKEIKITEKAVTFIMQYSGYNFHDGDKKVIRRLL